MSRVSQAYCISDISGICVTGMLDMTTKRKLQRASPAIGVGLVGVLLLLFLFGDKLSPLSPVESQLVGEWYHHPPETDTRTFFADRTFSTSNGQFVGTWLIKDGVLTVTYWKTYEPPMGYTIDVVVHCITRRRKNTVSWPIEIAADSRQFALIQPVTKDNPSGNWVCTRVPSK